MESKINASLGQAIAAASASARSRAKWEVAHGSGSMLASGVRGNHNFSALGLLQPADEDGRIDNRYAVKLGIEQIAVERHQDIGMCCVHQRDEIVVVGIAHPRGWWLRRVRLVLAASAQPGDVGIAPSIARPTGELGPRQHLPKLGEQQR
jgi:hypothetical protein